MKNANDAAKASKEAKMAAALESFNRWFNRSGQWIYESREKALQTWRERGINGLSPFMGS